MVGFSVQNGSPDSLGIILLIFNLYRNKLTPTTYPTHMLGTKKWDRSTGPECPGKLFKVKQYPASTVIIHNPVSESRIKLVTNASFIHQLISVLFTDSQLYMLNMYMSVEQRDFSDVFVYWHLNT